MRPGSILVAHSACGVRGRLAGLGAAADAAARAPPGAFVAPELRRAGGGGGTPASDMFALGATVRALAAACTAEYAPAAASQEPAGARASAAEVEAFVAALTAPDPTARPSAAAAAAAEAGAPRAFFGPLLAARPAEAPRECCCCFDDHVRPADGVACAEGALRPGPRGAARRRSAVVSRYFVLCSLFMYRGRGAGHFVCTANECLHKWLQTGAGAGARSLCFGVERRALEGRLRCPAGGCRAPPYTDAALSQHLPLELFQSYLDRRAEVFYSFVHTFMALFEDIVSMRPDARTPSLAWRPACLTRAVTAHPPPPPSLFLAIERTHPAETKGESCH